MSIPRAKITASEEFFMFPGERVWEFVCPFEGCGSVPWASRDASWIHDEARIHLTEEHGVRRVGSLTADDIGKWIEVDERPMLFGVLTGVSHDRMTATYTLVHSGALSQMMPPSTPCRVTEERP